jgi:hypothetical protein
MPPNRGLCFEAARPVYVKIDQDATRICGASARFRSATSGRSILRTVGADRNAARCRPTLHVPVQAGQAGKQVPARPHDTGSSANETVDGLDATTETLRKAAEDTPSGTGLGNLEKTPVFDRADLAPKI